MSLLIKGRIESDLFFLNNSSVQNFKDITCLFVLELLKRKEEYKNNLISRDEKILYSQLKFQLHALSEAKIPFRMVEIVKQCLKSNRRCPYQLYQLCESPRPVPLSKQERKTVLAELRKNLVETGLYYEEAFKIIESIHWVHGTNSAILPMLWLSDYTMLCAGALLDLGYAPMCGELSKGGMATEGLNQQWISVETVRDIARSWRYAWLLGNTFEPSRYDEPEPILIECLKKLKTLSIDDDTWDEHVITLLQLKQWKAEEFKQLQEKYTEEITGLLAQKDVILEMKESPEVNAKSFFCTKRLIRLKNVFSSQANAVLSEEGKNMILDPFPILIASRSSKCFFVNGTQDANIPSAKWGEDVDTVFVHEKDISTMQKWIENQGLTDKIQVHNIEEISPFWDSAKDYPVHHTSRDAVGEHLTLSSGDYTLIQERIQTFILRYLETFSGGIVKEGYGVVRGTYTALFSAIIMEMRLAQGARTEMAAKDVPILGFFHGMGRIDETSSISLEQKIVHDADCIFSGNRELLWLCKEQFPEDLLDLFIYDAKRLMQLIEQPLTKSLLYDSADPFRALVQIIYFSKKFPFLMAHLRAAKSALCLPADHILSSSLEQEIVAWSLR